MSSNVVNATPYIRTTREFPEDVKPLSVELSRAYIDIANSINARTIGLFSVNRPAQNGEAWYLTKNLKQQGFRQVYTFTTTADIPLGFKLTSVATVVHMFGVYLSGTSWYGLIPATNVAIAGQITFWLEVDGASTSSDLIKFNTGGGTPAPAITSGVLVVEWISEP